MLDEIVPLMQKLIQNKCVNPPGNEMRSIKTIEQYLKSKGIDSEIFESTTERGNLLAEIKGTSHHPSLMFGPSHVDVVPVEEESSWSIPPFEGRVEDDFIWGRGSLDMLYIVACQAVVFSHLASNGFKPRGDLKLLIVADEEAAGTFGAKWMVDNYPDKVKVEYLISETGGEPVEANRVAFWYGEKGSNWTRLIFKGAESHGSAPLLSDNAAIKLAKAIERITDYQPPRDLTLVRNLIAPLSMGGLTKSLASSSITLPQVLKSLRKSNPGMAGFLHAISQMTWSPNVCEAGTKINVVPAKAQLDIDIRTLPGQNEEYVRTHLQHALGDLIDDVVIERVPEELGGAVSPGTMSDMDSPFVDIMRGVLRELRGEEFDLVPLFSPGATDARFFRQAFGTQAYGFAITDGRLDLSTLFKLFHGDDERVSLGTIELTANAYKMVAERFLS